MKKSILLILLSAFFFGNLIAQDDEEEEKVYNYTYISDKIIHSERDLYNYPIVPKKIAYDDLDNSRTLIAGEVTLDLTQGNFVINGIDLEGMYSITSITKQKYGYLVDFMHMTETSIFGTMKIILNDWKMLDAVIFKTKESETHIMLMAEKSDAKAGRELDYFTISSQRKLSSYLSLNAKTLTPYFVQEYGENGYEQHRMYIDDSLSVKFYEESFEVIEKDYTKKYSIKKTKMLENQSQNSNGVRYLLQLISKDHPNKGIDIYLDQMKRAVGMQLGDKSYWFINSDIEQFLFPE